MSVLGSERHLSGTLRLRDGRRRQRKCALPLPEILQTRLHRPRQRHVWHRPPCQHRLASYCRFPFYMSGGLRETASYCVSDSPPGCCATTWVKHCPSVVAYFQRLHLVAISKTTLFPTSNSRKKLLLCACILFCRSWRFLFSGTVKSRLNISKLFLPIMRFISHYTIVLWLNYIVFCDGKYKVNIIPVSYQVEFILKLFSFMTNEGMLRYLSTVCRWSDKKKKIVSW